MTASFEEIPNNDNMTDCLAHLEDILTRHNFTVAELITLYANLGYRIGQNIANQFYDRKIGDTPDLDKLQKLYYSEPSVDVALMLNALTMLTWIQSLENSSKKE